MKAAPLSIVTRLRRRFTLLVLASLHFCLFGMGLLAAPATEPALCRDYEQAVGSARGLAAESSWGQAREWFRAALALAPDTEAKRWCELWLAEAEWRAEPASDWSARPTWQQRHEDEFARLLEPHGKGLARDGFWRAVLEARARFRGEDRWAYNDTAWQDWLAVADWLAEQPRDDAGRGEYFAFLRGQAERIEQGTQYGDAVRERLIRHFGQAREAAGTADERAWACWQLARFVGGDAKRSMEERRRCWSEALAAARGQTIKLTVRAQELLWRVRLCEGEKPATGAVPEYARWEAEIEELRRLGELSPRAEDHECAKAMLALRALWAQPRFTLPVPRELEAGRALRLSYGACGIRQIDIAVYRHSRDRILAEARRLSGQEDADWDAVLENVRELVLRKTVELSTGPALGWQRGEIVAAETLPAGIYTVETEGRTATGVIQRRETLLVGALRAAAFSVAEGRHDLFVFDGTAARPVADAEVRGVLLPEKGVVADLKGRTDADGRLHLPQAPENDHYREWMVAAFVGGRPLLCRVSDRVTEESERLIADLFLDRPIYRPGETVRWKLILRERRDGRFALPRLTRALVLDAGSEDTVLAEKQPLALDVFGTASGELTIPASARPGYFRMKLGWADDSETDIARGNWLGFRVDNFVAPQVAARVELASGADSLQPGRELVFEVGADYLSGGPVVGATVACTLACSNSTEADWQRAESEEAPWRAWADEMRKKTLTGTTGADGKVRLTVQLPADLPDGVSCTLEGKVMPTGLPEVEVRSGLWIARGGLCALPTGTEYSGLRVAEAGERVAFPLAVKDGMQRPAVFVGTAVLVERRWSELWRSPDGRIVDETRIGAERRSLELDWGDSMPEGWRQVHAGYRETAVAEAAVRADAEGTIVPEFRMPGGGLFTVRLKNAGGAVPVLGAEQLYSTVLVPDRQMAVPALPPSLAVLALPSRVSREGPFAALAVLPEGVGVGWLVLQGEDEAKCLRFATRQRAVWVRTDRLPQLGSRLGLEMTFPRGDSLERERRWYDLPDPKTRLEVGLEPAAALARPGETTTVRLHAKQVGRGGEPAAVAVAVWDEALTQLAGWREPEPLFLSRFSPVHEPGTEIVGDVDGYRNPSTSDPRLAVSALADLAKMGAALRVFADSVGGADEEIVVLSPFEVACDADTGYCATTTLAGTRLRTELREAAPPIMAAGARAIPEIEVRRHFSASAFWAPQIVTDAKGEATVSFTYPDNLTQWRIEAYAVGADGNSFGTATTFTRTSLPFQARLNLPRLLVAGDSAEVGATLVNRTGAALEAQAELEVGGAAGAATERSQQAATLRAEVVSIAAQGSARVAWPVRSEKSGTAEFTLKAWTEAERDGMELKLPVLEDGIVQETAASGRLARGEVARVLTLELPEPFDPARTTVRVQLTGSHAAALLDALPYLADYPYGCVEQTMSRILPAVVARKTLGELGFNAAAVESRILGKETPADAARRAKTAGLGRLDEVIAKSLARLVEAQRGDGTFGWWPGAQVPDLWMTAYVAWGLELARASGVALPEQMAERIHASIRRFRPRGNESSDCAAWALAALAAAPLDESAAKWLREGFVGCFAEREKLSATGRACLALAAAKLGTPEERAVVLRNLENGAMRAESTDLGDTVHWGATSGYWRASEGAVENTALTLLALLELDHQHALVEPAMNWLVLNRRSGHWASTRDTAFAVLALAKFVQVRGEAQGETAVAVLVDGAEVGRVTLNRETLLAGAAEMVLPAAALHGGNNPIELRRVSGDGTAYAVALAESWAAGATVKPAGHMAQVARGFVRQKATPTLVGTLRIDPEPLVSGGAAVAGEEVQAVVTVTVPNELEYVMVEVPKPAGCEPLNALSGWDARIRRVADGELKTDGRGRTTAGGGPRPMEDSARAIYREERDEKSVFFLDRLEAGTWEIRFGMRAVTPGNFRALPVKIEAMYVPEIRANSDARRMRIEARD